MELLKAQEAPSEVLQHRTPSDHRLAQAQAHVCLSACSGRGFAQSHPGAFGAFGCQDDFTVRTPRAFGPPECSRSAGEPPSRKHWTTDGQRVKAKLVKRRLIKDDYEMYRIVERQ